MGWKIYHSNSKGKNNILIFTETKLKGVFVIKLEKTVDERGYLQEVGTKRFLRKMDVIQN